MLLINLCLIIVYHISLGKMKVKGNTHASLMLTAGGCDISNVCQKSWQNLK